MDVGRRDFFKKFFLAGSALAVSKVGGQARQANAATPTSIRGTCLYAPSMEKADDFVELMTHSAPGEWSVYPLTGSMTDRYFSVKSLYQEAKAEANTFVGVVDPGSFAVVHEAIVDSGGSFHYITYEERNRVVFSAQI